ncbi:RCC1 domain-containing protein [Paraliomyxa miuraensis]|uniref:RCC1 domain-containing protein n=1 Tax=Paraliomyxa miuraensis TaxID=376150 RepID=UPI0022574F17|nr:hypothetical protein [Paraliomyxa miuraensis]MCX4246701.1 hypothetical protein [Paraliomyxa miuraensis]
MSRSSSVTSHTLAAVLAIAAASSSACLNFDPFGCQEDTQCDAQAMGRCEAVGYCSYPDLACIDTGYRYEDGAGDGLGGQCVGVEVAGTDTDGTTTTAMTDPDPETSLDSGSTTMVDPTTGSDDEPTTGDACGGAGQACCAGDGCDAGLSCNDGLCGCVQAIAVGNRHTCAIKLDGNVQCWGANDLGQLASAEPPMSPTPVDIPGFGGALAATALYARNHTCALTGDDTLWCWGDNASQKASVIDPSPVVLIPGQATWAVPAAAAGVGGSHTCVGRGMGQAPTCWGDNGSGQLSGMEVPPGPAIVPGGFEPFVVALGDAHTCMSTLMGDLYCWGDNGNGQIGADPVTTPSLSVPQVVGVPPIGTLATGAQHTCVTVGSEVQCFGRNNMGQLGNGTNVDAFTPSAAMFPPGAGVVAQLVAGADQTCAVMAAGELYCWGGNQNGELLLEPDKMGEDGFALTPRLIEVGFDVAQIATGSTHTCALSTAGQVLCWGANDQGQIGDGTVTDALEPTPAQITCP